MGWHRRLAMLHISLWIQMSFVPVIHSKDENVYHLSRQDVLLIKDEQHPKCFTRIGDDLTCFFETADNSTYDLLYRFHGAQTENRCEMSVQRPEEGTFLHVCSLPSRDVFLYIENDLNIVEHNTHKSLHSRTVFVEEHFLLDPPYNVALHQNGQAGQLLVSWHTEVPRYCEDTMYRIRYRGYHQGAGEKTKELERGKYTSVILDSLKSGEETDVQVAVKCATKPSFGHWSSWTHSVHAMVPQSADDISLMCYTSDLQNITCQWNGSRYGLEKEHKLFYKMGLSEEWMECLVGGEITDLCRFHGDDSREIRVKLSSTLVPLGRTFYTEEFSLNKSIKTSPPGHLRAALEKDKLCLEWDAPLSLLSAHLQYEVGFRTKDDDAWMMVSQEGPQTGACLEVSPVDRYNVKVRAKPNGSNYSGYWSDWSDVLTGHRPIDTGMLLMLCIPVSILITALLISMFFSKLKQHFWPPVPNLTKVLQGFFTEIDRQTWDPPLTLKQWPEETTASVVEIISEGEVSGLRKPSEVSTHLLSPEGSFYSGEYVDGNPGTEAFPDYVTLDKNSVILCQKSKAYVSQEVEEKGVPGMEEELLQSCQSSCTDGSVRVPPCFLKDFLNYSYLPPAEAADCRVTPAREPGNLYTNLPLS